jgi:hypothetical protein
VNPVTSPNVTAVLLVKPKPPVIIIVIPVLKAIPPSHLHSKTWLGGMSISVRAAVVPGTTEALKELKILTHLVVAELLAKVSPNNRLAASLICCAAGVAGHKAFVKEVAPVTATFNALDVVRTWFSAPLKTSIPTSLTLILYPFLLNHHLTLSAQYAALILAIISFFRF